MIVYRCIGVFVHWYSGIFVGVLVYLCNCMLVYWFISCLGVLAYWCIGVLMYWCIWCSRYIAILV